MRNGAILFVIAIGVFQLRGARADPEECRGAINSYDTAMSDVSDQLNLYANCIADSRGHDDCSSEFMALHSAQDDFETAVGAYESDCQ
jgi:hypothetical protein